jgi:hypothetical protein
MISIHYIPGTPGCIQHREMATYEPGTAQTNDVVLDDVQSGWKVAAVGNGCARIHEAH